jgi:frataxin-like iron-binding protein CyaY
MNVWYEVSQHGILWIVWRVDSDYMGDHYTKDSTWECNEKANEHCRLLNEELKKQQNK